MHALYELCDGEKELYVTLLLRKLRFFRNELSMPIKLKHSMFLATVHYCTQ